MLMRISTICCWLSLCAAVIVPLAHATDPCSVRLISVRFNPTVLRQIDFHASAVAPKFHVGQGGQVRLASLDASGNLAIFSLDNNVDVILKPPGNLDFTSFSWGNQQNHPNPIYAAREDGQLIKFHEGQMTAEEATVPADAPGARSPVHTEFLLNRELWVLQKLAGLSRVRIMPVGKYGEGWDVDTDSTTFTTYPFMTRDGHMLLGLKDEQSLQVYDVKSRQLITKIHLDSPTLDPVWIENGLDPLLAYVSESRNVNIIAPLRPQVRVNTIKLRNSRPQTLNAAVLHEGRTLLVVATDAARQSEIFEFKDNQMVRVRELSESARLDRTKRALYPLKCGGSALVTFEKSDFGGEDILRVRDPERDQTLDFTMKFPDAQTVSGFDWLELEDCRALLAIQSVNGIRILQVTEPVLTLK